jgi:hypothetical protein
LPDDVLKVVSIGEKEDPPLETPTTPPPPKQDSLF